MNYKKVLCYGSLAVLLISLFPLLQIAIYAHPVADDYEFAILTHDAWENTHSFCSVILAAVQTAADKFMNWQGTYSAIFMFALHPGVWGEQYYFLTAWIMILAVGSGTWYFAKVVLNDILHAQKEEYITIVAIYLIFFWQLMPSPNQGFYWYNGAVYYSFFHAIMLFYFGIMLRGIQKALHEEKVYKYVILNSFVALFLGGGNFVTNLLTAEINVLTLLVFVWNNRKKKNHRWKLLAIPIVIQLVCMLLTVVAPGNQVRIAKKVQMSPYKAIISSFRYGAYKIYEWGDMWIFLMLLLLLPIMWGILKRITFEFKHPGVVFILSFCIFSSGFTPPLYGESCIGAGRLWNIYYAWFLLLVITNAFYILGYIQQHVVVKEDISNKGIFYLQYYVVISLFLIYISFVAGMNDRNNFSTLSALTSLRNGEAKQYDAEWDERTKLLLSEEKKVVVRPLSVLPYTLYFDDFQPDAENWRNIYAAKYYGKDMIYVTTEVED